MNIPDAAVEAAVTKMYGRGIIRFPDTTIPFRRERALGILAAAAPYIAAQALRDAAREAARIEPTDDAWVLNVEEYHRADFEDDPDDADQMFWEAGFRQGVAAVRLLTTARANRIEADHG